MTAKRYRDLDLLHPDLRPVVDRFLARLVEAKIMVMIIETWRSQVAHEENLRAKRSWVNRSKHQNTVVKEMPDLSGEVLEANYHSGHLVLPAALAIDVAPYEMYQLKGSDKLEWDADDPVWQKIGEIGEALGLKWGGRWKVRDMCHFEAPWA